MNTTDLTGPQQLLMRLVIKEHLESGQPVADLLMQRQVSDADRAAVAEELSDGAGAGYLS